MLNLKSAAYEQVKFNCQTQCSRIARKRKCLNCNYAKHEYLIRSGCNLGWYD